MELYKEILAKPFNFTQEEEYDSNTEKQNFCTNELERKERWRKKLKYLALERYVELTEQREKLANKDSAKSDAALEAEARDRVLKVMNRSFDKIKIAATDDKRFSIFINNITNLMDPHSDYFPPVEKEHLTNK